MSGDHNMYASGSGNGQRSGWRKRTIMEMAREAGICTWLKPPADVVERIEAFAELVRADEAEKYKLDIHSCGPTCTKIGCVAVREAVKAEREAIYNLVMEAPFKEFDRQEEEEFDGEAANAMKAMAFSLTSAIRKRGQA